jgi:heme/copper-type cytochrome/quinol oxidase subunit 3
MPGTVADDIELIIEDIRETVPASLLPATAMTTAAETRARAANTLPSRGAPTPENTQTAVLLVMVSITMFFLVLAVAFVVLRLINLHKWIGIELPGILWKNTLVLLVSSATLELARVNCAWKTQPVSGACGR